METVIVKRCGQEREILTLALRAGQILLENGAEVFRVEDTIYRICSYYGMDSTSVFVLSNGIFITTGDKREEYLAKVILIPVNYVNLSKVVAVNQLSREIAQGRYAIAEAELHLEQISGEKEISRRTKILAAGVSCACFSVLFGGDVADGLSVCLAGILLYTYLTYIGKPYLSKITCHILGGVLATVLCLLGYHGGPGHHLEIMIISVIILMVPGVAFINAIRDIADADYISGAVRMLDAMLVFFCIAMGVGFVMGLYTRLMGGAFL